MITGFVKLYRENGLNVIPMQPKSKFPDVTEMPINPATGKRGWLAFQTEKCDIQIKEGQNGAVVMGRSSGGLVVIDLDDKALADVIFKDFEGLKKKTLVVETGKGYHIYTKPTGNIPEISIRTINEKGQRIDIQCQGTYVLVPGSIHPDTGREYKIISSVLDIDTIDLDNFMKRLGEVGFNIEGRRRRMSEVLKGVGQGERNDSAFRLAMCSRHFWGLKDIELLEILNHWNRKVMPPLSDLEIKNIVRSAMSYDIDDIKFKDKLDEVEKPLTELELKYDDIFWKEIQEHCKKSNISRSSLLFHCINCRADMPNDPTNEAHKTHMITIKYK